MKINTPKPINIFVRRLDDFFSDIIKLRMDYKANLKFWFAQNDIMDRRILRWKDSERIETIIDNNLSYIHWEIKTNGCKHQVIYDERKYLLKRVEQNTFLMLDKTPYEKGVCILFKDAVHKEELPDCFIKVHSFTDISTLLDFCLVNNKFDFSIEDSSKFKKDKELSSKQGTYVAVEIKTGNYWYLDLLHKNHYEVFDHTGKKHLGEADLNGRLIDNSSDKTKSIK